MLGEKGWSGDKVSRGREGGKVVRPPEVGQSGDDGRVTYSMVVTWRTEREGHKETGQKGWGEQRAERQDSRGDQRDKPNERERRGSEGVEIWTQMSAELFAYA